MTCDKKRICEHWNTFSRFCVGLGGVTLGIGTLFLGLAAFWKASEIYDVVTRIQSLTEVVSSIKDIQNQNSIILKRIDDQISKNNASKFEDIKEKTKSEFKKQLKLFILSEDISIPIKHSASEMRFVKQNATIDTLNEDEIFNHWVSLKTPEQRIRYLSRVFENYLKSGKLEPLIEKTDQ